MKIVICTYSNDESIMRRFAIRPETGSELHEAIQDIADFVTESYVDINDEGDEEMKNNDESGD